MSPIPAGELGAEGWGPAEDVLAQSRANERKRLQMELGRLAGPSGLQAVRRGDSEAPCGSKEKDGTIGPMGKSTRGVHAVLSSELRPGHARRWDSDLQGGAWPPRRRRGGRSQGGLWLHASGQTNVWWRPGHLRVPLPLYMRSSGLAAAPLGPHLWPWERSAPAQSPWYGLLPAPRQR